jgi:glycine cleavage system H protein
MTVLLVVLSFALFIALDYLFRRRQAAFRQTTVFRPGLPSATHAEPVWVAGYQLLEELHYHRGHTWARVLAPDTALVGIDDFARKLVGPSNRVMLPAVGSRLSQGAEGFRIEVDGKSAGFLAPVDGQVVETNPDLRRQPRLATDDPYGRGWILKVRSSNLARDLHNLLSGSLVRRWMEDTGRRLDIQLMALSGSVLQDGGEPLADFARHLTPEEWKRLVGEFLLT